MRTVLMILLVSGSPLGTCIQPPVATPCTALFAYGVNATVTDAVTATAITDATLTLTEGSYTEVMQHFPTGDYVGAGERAGTYTLTATAPGYQNQTITDIVVTADECHVRGVHLDVRLLPAS